MTKHELHQVPVTALALSEDYLFAGEGPILKVHRRSDNHLLESCTVFASQAIHGIVIHSDGIIIWGGRLVARYLFTQHDSTLITLASTYEANDWILDIAVSARVSGTSQKAALITAHNAVLSLDLEDSTSSLKELTSNSKCILYSARLHWIDTQRVLIASGTVFGDIIVWSCMLQEHRSPSSTLHHVLLGHEGSIFGVDIFESENRSGMSRLLASCSDDRTIRIWDISSLPETATDPQATADLTSTRETGFGVNIADMLPGNASGGVCIAKAWGHASRIWGVKFIPSQESDFLSYVVSFGEDATDQFWGLEETRSGEFLLSHFGGSTLHSGKNIWSWAIFQDNLEQVTIASGGADGSIVIEPQVVPFSHESDHIQTWSIQDLASSYPEHFRSRRQDKLRNYAFLDKTNLIVTTDAGNILLLTRDDEGQTQINWICQEQKLRGYSVVTSLPDLSVAFLAGIDGSVMLYDGGEIKELVKSSSKTAALFAQTLPCSSEAAHRRVGLLIANVEAKTALFTRFSVEDTRGHARTSNDLSTVELSLPKGFITTSFLIIHPNQAEEQAVLVLGSRNGSVAVYRLTEDLQNEVLTHQYLLPRAHSFDSVTDLAWVDGPSPNNHDGHLFSTGKDGTYAIHALSGLETDINLRLINQTSLPLGTNIEGLRIDEATGHLIIWGFHSRQFIVFDVIEESEIMNIDCGGANRSWKFEPENNLQGGRFVWTKASELCLFSQNQRTRHGLNKGGHGRDIKAVAVASHNPMGTGILFATGAEDTDIKLFTYQKQVKLPHFRCFKTLRKHNTGIQQLEWSADGKRLYSSGGFEEFFVWKVEAAPIVGLGVFCESVCPPENAMPDLRIMGFSVRETDTAFTITMVRSDSTLRVYHYNPHQEAQWEILMAGNYLKSCLTQCLHIERSTKTHSVITAGTDGYIAFYTLDLDSSTPAAEPKELKWISRSNVHQNTVHSMKLHWFNEYTCLLLTGGDDNAVAFTICTWIPEEGKPRVKTLAIPRAHTAAVTGVEILASPEPTLLTVATSSIDQRVKIWEVSYDSSRPGVDGLSVQKKSNHFTAVADVSGLSALDESSFIVCGVGMNVLSQHG